MAVWRLRGVPFTCIQPIPLSCALRNSAFGLQVRVIRRQYTKSKWRPEGNGKHLEFNLALTGKTLLLSAELESILSRTILVIYDLKC